MFCHGRLDARLHPSPTFCEADPRRARAGSQPVRTWGPFVQPTLTSASGEGVSLPAQRLRPPPPPSQSASPSVARLQRCKSMHHFSPTLRSDFHKSFLTMEQPLRLFAGLNFTDVRLLPFRRLNATQRGWICKTNAAVCARESQVAQKGHSSLRLCIMHTSNQSKTKAHMQKILL